MKAQNLLVLLMAVFALAIVAPSVSALTLGEVTSVEVNGVEVLGAGASQDLTLEAGERIEVRVLFEAERNASDVRVNVELSGEGNRESVSSRFPVISGNTYSRTVFLDLPFDLDEDLNRAKTLRILIEDESGNDARASVSFTIQREADLIVIDNIDMQPEVKAGELLAVDVVLNNRGSNLADKTYLKVRIPELGLETTTFYGDLSARDQGGNVIEREDTEERRTFLRVPLSAPAGLYTVLFEAYNSDSITRVEKRVNVVGAGQDTRSVSAVSSKTFAVGETGQYQLTLVNTGSVVRIYELTVDAPSDLNVDVSEPVVVVPAGSSRTVTLRASSSTEGSYSFTANVNADGQLISSKTFRANVEGTSRTGAVALGSTAVVLTVILAIVFVVLLVVLIVLLTRKPEQKEEFGESYY